MGRLLSMEMQIIEIVNIMWKKSKSTKNIDAASDSE